MLNDLELAALKSFRAGHSPASASGQPSNDEAWLRFGLQILLEIARRVRAMRFSPMANAVIFKNDGSPTVSEETAIEHYLSEQLHQFAPQANLIGEESGGRFSGRGIDAAIDPVDGTWALVNRSATHATSLTVFRDAKVFLGMVANAANGEIAYALQGQPSRLIQLSCFGEADTAFRLPLDQTPGERPLINLQPARGAERLSAGLYRAWNERQISLLKGMGGSPCWALLEAAKGAFIYVNRWSDKVAEPFDLAGSVLLLRQAGGDSIDLDGRPIDALYHQGPFISGIKREAMLTIAQICRHHSD